MVELQICGLLSHCNIHYQVCPRNTCPRNKCPRNESL